jgi:hypothetical protein
MIMSVGIGSIGTVQQGASTASPVVASSPVAASGFTNYVDTTATDNSVHGTRLLLDPTAGFITEYLSANGSQVISQTPSAITVAYLRNGLTADGLPKTTNQSAQHVAETA